MWAWPRLRGGEPTHLQVLMFGHDGDLVAVHAQDLPLQVDQLPLTHLHVVPRLQVVLPLLPCTHRKTNMTAPRIVRPLPELEGTSGRFFSSR